MIQVIQIQSKFQFYIFKIIKLKRYRPLWYYIETHMIIYIIHFIKIIEVSVVHLTSDQIINVLNQFE